MEENVTVQQLSQALNQLLDAYEDLQKKNAGLKQELENAQLENEDLKEQVSLLSSTTSEQTNEMDAMINRIESILSTSEAQETVQEEETTSNETMEEDTSDNTGSLYDMPKEEKKEEDTSKDQPDLGRMQALLNGFNN